MKIEDLVPFRGCLLGWGGLPGPGVGGACLVQGGGGIPACTEADTLPPPPVDRILDTRL